MSHVLCFLRGFSVLLVREAYVVVVVLVALLSPASGMVDVIWGTRLADVIGFLVG